jgi:hypothetical protein
MLSYPKETNIRDTEIYKIYQNYNIDTTYQTFEYLFDKLKKGIYISFRNGKLDVFLPFSNFDYHNNWSKIIKSKDPKLFKRMKKDTHNLSDPSRWYANNCFLNTERYKYTENSKDYDYKEFLEEGDKTVIPLKYFLIYFEKYCNSNDLNIPDVDYFFNPRDFPVLRHNNLEPYDKIFPNQKLEPQYIHDNYTPILSQSGNTGYHDIPVPTEDDMLRISPDIYPNSCKNAYNNIPEFDTKWKDKIDVCVFRGNATGCGITVDSNMRLKAAHLSYLWKKKGSFKNGDGIDILNAKLTGWNNRRPKLNDDIFKTLNPKKFDFGKDVGKQNFMDIKEQSKHKYILNIDGHVKAFRLGNEMRMGSVVLLVDSPYTLWFQRHMVNLTHYVQIKRDLSDLEERLQWCLENDDLCENIAKNSKIFYDKYLSKDATYKYYYNLINNLSKIRKAPSINTNMNDNSLSLIVAYRDPGDGSRKAQLDIFLQQMQILLNNRTDYHIYVIEQETDRPDYDSLPDEFKQVDSRMAKFNLGRLKNIGFQISNREHKDDENAYYILSDVDLIPSMELLPKYLQYPKEPIHLANMGTRYNLDGKNKSFLGGVLSINKDNFHKSNGYPNNFWGWGGEDDVLSYRLYKRGIGIEKPNESVIDLEEMSRQDKLQKLWDDNMLMKKELKKQKVRYEKDNVKKRNNGINDIKRLYKITDRTDNDKISHIKVFLNIEESTNDDTPVKSVKSNTPVIPEPDKKYIRAPVPPDGWCSMHAIDQLLKYVGVEEFNDIPKMNEVPLTIHDLAEPGNKYVVKNVQEWMSQFRENSDLWKNSFKEGNHSMPETACNYIDIKTNNQYECLRNVFIMAIDDMPDELGIKASYTFNDIKIISRYIPEIKEGVVSIDTDKVISDLEMVIFINTGNHWEIIYSPDIPQINKELPVEPVVKPVIKSDIKIGSNVKWTEKDTELTGIVEKITKTSYKICCKPGKNSGDASSQYMIKFDRVSLNKV